MTYGKGTYGAAGGTYADLVGRPTLRYPQANPPLGPFAATGPAGWLANPRARRGFAIPNRYIAPGFTWRPFDLLPAGWHGTSSLPGSHLAFRWNWPAEGARPGALVLARLVHDDDVPLLTIPAGWSLLGSFADDGFEHSIYWRRVTAPEVAYGPAEEEWRLGYKSDHGVTLDGLILDHALGVEVSTAGVVVAEAGTITIPAPPPPPPTPDDPRYPLGLLWLIGDYDLAGGTAGAGWQLPLVGNRPRTAYRWNALDGAPPPVAFPWLTVAAGTLRGAAYLHLR